MAKLYHNSHISIFDWINAELKHIATVLPSAVKNPESFECGLHTGYKQCLLDLLEFLNAPE